MNFVITNGNTYNWTQAEKLINMDIYNGVSVFPDKSYHADKIIEYITLKFAIDVIAHRKKS